MSKYLKLVLYIVVGSSGLGGEGWEKREIINFFPISPYSLNSLYLRIYVCFLRPELWDNGLILFFSSIFAYTKKPN